MKFTGLIAASITPFNDDLSLALDRVDDMMDYYRSRPLAGLFVCGSTGECSAMTDEERMKTAESFVNASAGKLPIIVHVGSSSVESSRMFASHAKSIGADAIAAVAPYYFKPDSPECLVDSLARISAAAPELPFYYYHIPALTGVSFPVAPMIPQLFEKIPSFAGIKYTYEDLMDYQLSVDACGDRAQVLFGRDEILLAGLALGAKGGVGSTYNFIAKLYDQLINNFNSGNINEAQRLQLVSQKFIKIMCKYGCNAGKLCMKFAGVDAGASRFPTKLMSQDMEKSYYEELRKLGLLDYM